MFNDFNGGDYVWVNGKKAIVKQTFPSIMGKEYLVEYYADGHTTERVQPWFVMSREQAIDKGYWKSKGVIEAEAKAAEMEKVEWKVKLGNFVEGTYKADELVILVIDTGKFPTELMHGSYFMMKLTDVKSNPHFEQLDQMMQFTIGMLAATEYYFEDGKYAQKALMGGTGLWREYDINGDKLTLPDQKGTIEMALQKDGRLQQKTLDGTGQEMFIYYKKESE